MPKVSIFLEKIFQNISGLQRYLTPALWLGLILLLGTILRFYDLGTESYWIDEMYTVIEAQQNIPEMLTSGRLDQPPAYYLPFHLWVETFGTQEVSTRSFSALVGIGSIGLIYLVGRELFGKTVGLISAFLMAISGFQIYYSQIARFYSFFELMSLLSFLFFILAFQKKKMLYFCLYGVASILMIYSHTFGAFILAAQNLVFLFKWKKYKNLTLAWLSCQLLILAAFVPYVYILVIGQNGVGGAVAENVGKMPVPALSEPLHSVYRFILPSRRLYGQEVILASYVAAGVLLLIGSLIYIARQGKNNWLTSVKRLGDNLPEVSDLKAKLILVGSWLLCPIVLPFLISLLIIPVYKDYYTISAAPALYLLLALGLYNARKVLPLLISISILVILIVPSLGVYYVKDMNEQWPEAALYVEKNSKPTDVIVFAPNESQSIQQRTFSWYYQGTLPSCGLGVRLTDSAVWKALTKCLDGHQRFWVIIRGTSENVSYQRYTSFFINPNQTAIVLKDEQHFFEITVYLFELADR